MLIKIKDLEIEAQSIPYNSFNYTETINKITLNDIVIKIYYSQNNVYIQLIYDNKYIDRITNIEIKSKTSAYFKITKQTANKIIKHFGLFTEVENEKK